MHKNNNQALGNYGIYEIEINGKTYKIGKADLDRVIKSSGDPVRIRQQIRKLRRKYSTQKVYYTILERLFGYTTQEAKAMEKAILQEVITQIGYVPEGNKKSYKP